MTIELFYINKVIPLGFSFMKEYPLGFSFMKE